LAEDLIFEVNINWASMDKKNIILSSQGWFIDSIVGNIKQVYSFEKRLSGGAFSIVFQVRHRETGRYPRASPV